MLRTSHFSYAVKLKSFLQQLETQDRYKAVVAIAFKSALLQQSSPFRFEPFLARVSEFRSKLPINLHLKLHWIYV